MEDINNISSKTLNFDTFENLKSEFNVLLHNGKTKVQALAITSNGKYVTVNVSLYKDNPEIGGSGTLVDSIVKLAIL